MRTNKPRPHPAQMGGAKRARFLQNCLRAARERAVKQAQKAAAKRWKFLSGNADEMGGRIPPLVTLPYVSIQHVGEPAPEGVLYRRIDEALS